MKGRFPCLLAAIAVFSSCEEKKEVVVTETRPLTTRDKTPKLHATSDERFRDAKPSPVKGTPPEGQIIPCWAAYTASCVCVPSL